MIRTSHAVTDDRLMTSSRRRPIMIGSMPIRSVRSAQRDQHSAISTVRLAKRDRHSADQVGQRRWGHEPRGRCRGLGGGQCLVVGSSAIRLGFLHGLLNMNGYSDVTGRGSSSDWRPASGWLDPRRFPTASRTRRSGQSQAVPSGEDGKSGLHQKDPQTTLNQQATSVAIW